MKFSVCIALLCGAVLNIGLLSISPTFAQAAPQFPDGLSMQTIGQFDSTFQTLSDQYHVTFVCEGVPLVQALSSENLNKLVRSLGEGSDHSLSEQIQKIALAYDYDCDNSSTKTFVLRKRYSDRNDLPCVTGPEVLHAVRSVLHVADGYNSEISNLDSAKACYALYASLTPEQQSRIDDQNKTGKSMPVAEMSLEQRQLAIATGWQMALGSDLTVLRIFVHHLETLPNAKTIFTQMMLRGKPTFGYQGPFGPGGIIWHCPLTNGFTSQVGGSYRFRVIDNQPEPESLTNDPFSAVRITTYGVFGDPKAHLKRDPSLPTDTDRLLAGGMLSNRLHSTVTLGEFAREINTAFPSKGIKITVDEALSEKPLCIYGADFTTPNRIVRIAADIYGLAMLTPDEKNFALMMPTPTRKNKDESFAAEITRLIPPSLLRGLPAQTTIMSGMLSSEPKAKDRKTKLLSLDPSLRQRLADGDDVATYQEAKILALESYYFPTARRLLILAKNQDPTSEDTTKSVSSLGPEATRLIALMMLSEAGLGSLEKLSELTLPKYMDDPESLVFRMHSETSDKNVQILSAQFGYRDDSGFHAETGTIFARSVPQ